ncbi:hypothetical protein DBZ36_17205 [Alginatibacterium sediminis]|uniref:Right-handed parallel beta-helix repeat-containing protein n=1 Tax=Alginatibacterium sediminis TaxID=2164068 RepID=A0A420E769_9ALTE|nr:hypothetical protein [Alginatibacterium sediminis]RKF14391.1 hypothetical protein DBZ36_17205 [Alginatibacterium sediminis]
MKTLSTMLFTGILIFAALSLFPAGVAYAATSLETCHDRSIQYRESRHRRSTLAFATELNVAVGTDIVSNCVTLSGIENDVEFRAKSKTKISINGGPFETLPVKLKQGDQIKLMVNSGSKPGAHLKTHIYTYETSGNTKKYSSVVAWHVRVEPTINPPEQWQIGPSHQYQELEEVMSLVGPGDVVLIEGDATYKPFSIRGKNGTPDFPITIRGVEKNGRLPKFSGGTPKYNWTFSLRDSHFWNVENIILEGGGICYRHQSHGITFKNVIIRKCGNGILGTDKDSGSLTLSGIQLSESGGKPKGSNWRHGIYMATDRDRYPNSIFRIENSLLYNNLGNAIKSRAERTEVYNNWIETPEHKQSYYALELIGFDGYAAIDGIEHDVVGNVLRINSPTHTVRIGGDGTGSSRGPSRFVSNIFVFSQNYNSYVFRANHQLKSLLVEGNIFAKAKVSDQAATLVFDSIKPEGWVQGYPDIIFNNNLFNFETRNYRNDNEALNSDTNYQSHISFSNNQLQELESLSKLISWKRISEDILPILASLSLETKSNISNPRALSIEDIRPMLVRPTVVEN